MEKDSRMLPEEGRDLAAAGEALPDEGLDQASGGARTTFVVRCAKCRQPFRTASEGGAQLCTACRHSMKARKS